MCDFELVDPEFVEALLASGNAGRPWQLLEAHFCSEDHPQTPDPATGLHIPGAIEVHPSYLEAGTNRSRYYPDYRCPEDGKLLPDEELVRALRRLGLTPDTLVVVYGREPDGTMAASRLAWALLYAGVKRVRMLDGGMDAWTKHRGPVTSRHRLAWEMGADDRHVIDQPGPAWTARKDLLATTAEVAAASSSGSDPFPRTLVDVRKRGEWDGSLTNYYPFLHKAGHIPGSTLQGDWNNLLDMETHKIATTLEAVAARWRKLGIIRDEPGHAQEELIFYCGTGWRSSVSFLIAHLLGLRARNYDGGFYRWSWDERNAIETTIPRPALAAS